MGTVDCRLILDGLADAVIVVDESERIVLVNSRAEALLGRTALELVGHPVSMLVPPRLQSIQPEGLSRMVPDGRPVPWPIVRRDGRELILELRLTRPPSTTGAQGGLLVATLGQARETNLRERRLRSELSARAAQFKALLNHLPMGVAYLDDKGQCRAANGLASRYLGRSHADLIGAESKRLLGAVPALHAAFLRCLESGEAQVESGVAWKSGKEGLYLDWRFEPLPAAPRDGSQPHGALALIADVTPSRRAAERFEQAAKAAEEASRQKSQFLSAVSHDLRTPVNALCLQAEWLMKLLAGQVRSEAELVNVATDIRHASTNLRDLVNDLLELNVLDAGAPDSRPTTFLLDEWLEGLLAPLKLTAQAKGLGFTWQVDRPGRVIRGDRTKLGRVLVNLVGNAVKFTQRGGVKIEAGAGPDGWFSLSVTDTGPGVPKDKLARIFDEFAQLRNPERDRTKGTGLGLAICRRLVQGAGGRLRVSSRLGRGSRFVALYPPEHLPNLDETPSSVLRPKAALPPVKSTRGHVLLVEDDPFSRRSLSRLIEREGFAIQCVESGVDAIEAINREVPSLVLLDLMLPGMDGTEVLRQLRQRYTREELPVVILSGDVLSGRTAELQALDVNGMLAKPIELDELLPLLRRWLAADAPSAPASAPAIPGR